MRRAGCHIANRIEVPATKPQQVISKSKRIREERCVSTVSLVPIGLSSSSCTNLSYPTQGKRAILLKGSSFPMHLANPFSKAHWTTLCSNLPKTLLVLGNFMLLSSARSLFLLSTAAGRPRLRTVSTAIKCARVLLIITGIYPKGVCSPEYCWIFLEFFYLLPCLWVCFLCLQLNVFFFPFLGESCQHSLYNTDIS